MPKSSPKTKTPSPVVEPEKVLPQVSFSEAECKDIVDYMNFVAQYATFNVKTTDIQKFVKLSSSLVAHVKKCEAHILEIKKHIKKDDKTTGL